MELQNTHSNGIEDKQTSTIPRVNSNEASAPRIQSKLGTLSMLSGIASVILEAIAFVISTIYALHQSLTPNGVHTINRGPQFLLYTFVVVFSLASLLVFSIPSFRKSSYPNTYGLMGLILNLTVLSSAFINLTNLIYFVLRGQ